MQSTIPTQKTVIRNTAHEQSKRATPWISFVEIQGVALDYRRNGLTSSSGLFRP